MEQCITINITQEEKEAYSEYVRSFNLNTKQNKSALLEKYENTYIGRGNAVYLHYRCVKCRKIIIGFSKNKYNNGVKNFFYDNSEPINCTNCEEVTYCSDLCRESDKIHRCHEDERNTGYVCKLYH